MVHRLFSTDFQVSKAEYEAQKSRLMAYQYHELDDALGMAREIEARGGIAWEIENDDGQTMGRDEIQAQLRARRAELAGRPKTSDVARQTATTLDTWLRNAIETQPYTTAIVALGIGWLLGRMDRPL